MPSTVNGVGTHYYGKRNVTVRNGVCRRCNAQTTLTSYDTRLYVVVLFIPVFPLKRKRIIDQCPKCTGHYAIDARQWDVGGQLNASDAADRFANDPSPETAASCHAQLLSFFQYEQAQDLRREALSRLPDDAVLRANLGWQLHSMGQHAEASQLFDEALRLRPDLPAARSGKAQYLMGAGKLEEARRILDFLMEPGAAHLYDLAPLVALLGEFDRAGRSSDVLELAPHLLEELPHLKDDFWFRKVVRKAERAAGGHESLLPDQRRSLWSLLFSNSRDFSPKARGWARFGVLAAGILAALALHNESVRRLRKLHVVNRTGVPAQIRIDGGEPVNVDRQGVLTVGEGTHEVQISGPAESKEAIDVRSGYFDRWFQRPVWLVNVNAEAVLVQVNLVYSLQPVPPTPQFRIGETVLTFPNIDYLFDEEPPQSVQLDGKKDVVKSQLLLAEIDPESIVTGLADRNILGAMTVAEKVLSRRPDAKLLDAYATTAKSHQQAERAAKFLEGRLDRRPIDVAWHREYQDLRDTAATADELVRRYEKLAQDEPDSAAAWFLFSRVDPDRQRAERSLDRALELDPRLPWALAGRAARAFARGNWELAESGYTAAVSEMPGDDRFRAAKVYILLAQENYAAAEQECDGLNQHPTLRGLAALVRFWSRHRQGQAVDPAALAATVEGDSQPDPAARLGLEMYAAYAAGDWEKLRGLLKDPKLQGIPEQVRVMFLLSEMSPEELSSRFGNPAPLKEGLDELAVSLAFALADGPANADEWQQRALEHLRQGDRSDREVATVVGSERAPEIAELGNLSIGAQEQGLVCAALALKFPAQREAYLAQARRWQFFPFKHYWLVERAIAKLGSQQPESSVDP